MYCKYCGKQIPDGVAFCPQCGKRTSDDGAAGRPSSVAEHPKKHRGIKLLVAIIILMAAAAGVFAAWKFGAPYIKYRQAEQLLKAGSYSAAAEAFEDLGQYKDSADRRLESLRAAIPPKVIACGLYHTVGIKSNGTVIADGDNEFGQCDVSNWTNIVAVAAGSYHTVGLRSDGTVVAVGSNEYGQCDVKDWSDIISIAGDRYNTLGLRADGSVVAAGNNEFGQCEVGNWTNIVAVDAGFAHTVGLRSDGTVVAVGDDEYGQCEVGNWTDIVAVDAGSAHTVGLRTDGTVVAVGDDESGQCDVTELTDIKGIACAYDGTLCLRSDGTVLAPMWDELDEEELEETERELGIGSEWRTDVMAVYVGLDHIVSLRSDGTIATFCRNDICNVRGWTDIRMPVSLPNGENNTALSQRTPQPEENISEQDMAEQATGTSTETENDEYSMGVEEYDLLIAYYTGDYDDYDEIESSLYDLLDRMRGELGENNDLVRLANCVEQAIYNGNTPLMQDALSILKSNFADKTADEYEGLPYVEGNVIELTRYDEYNTAMVVDLDTGYYGLYDRNTSAFLYYPDKSCYECGADMISVEKDGYYGCVYYSGESAIGCYYEEPLEFYNGVSSMCVNGSYGAVTSAGKEILSAQYAEVDLLNNTNLIAASTTKGAREAFALFDLNGNQLTDDIYGSFTLQGDILYAAYSYDDRHIPVNREWYDLYDVDGNPLIGDGTALPDIWGVKLPSCGIMLALCDGRVTNLEGYSYPDGSSDYYRYITEDLTYLNGNVYEDYCCTFNEKGYAIGRVTISYGNSYYVVLDTSGNEIDRFDSHNDFVPYEANDYVYHMISSANYNQDSLPNFIKQYERSVRDAIYIRSTGEYAEYLSVKFISGTNLAIVTDLNSELYGLYDGPELVFNTVYNSMYFDSATGEIVATRGAEEEHYSQRYYSADVSKITTDNANDAFNHNVTAESEGVTAASGTVTTTAEVNLYKGPGTDYDSFGTVPSGTQLTSTGYTNNWTRVQYNGQELFVYSAYVSDGSGNSGITTSSSDIGTVTGDLVNVRSGPGTNYDAIGSHNSGDTVTITGSATDASGNNWYQISYNGQTAYISAQYVTKN